MGLNTFELEPTKENVLKTITTNDSGRNASVWQFAKICNALDNKCSIAIDAEWGCGKTFFIKQVKMLIEAYNDFTSALSIEEKETIKSAFSNIAKSKEETESFQPQVCVYYDAWKNDMAPDPILSLIHEILKETAQNYPFKKSVDGLKLAASIADFFTGKNTTNIVSLFSEKDPLEVLKEGDRIHQAINDFFDSLLFEQGNRLVIFIDELDRCRPAFAVQLLEEIKHYFSNDRITFVFSINKKELQHAIKGYYGEGFDACRYLDRFFDYPLSLPPVNIDVYCHRIGLRDDQALFDWVCLAIIKHYKFGYREAEKFWRIARITVNPPRMLYYTFTPTQNALFFAKQVFIPIIIGLRMSNIALCQEFLDGKNPQTLVDVLGENESVQAICSVLLNSEETFSEKPTSDKLTVRVSDKLVAAYSALFSIDSNNEFNRKSIGDCEFDYQIRTQVLSIASMLTGQSNYN